MSRQPGPQTYRWLLQLPDGGTLSQGQARHAKIVEPEQIEEALVAAPRHRQPSSEVAVYGRDATGRLVCCYLPQDTAGLTGERAAAVDWPSGAPRVHWRRVKIRATETRR